MSAEESPPERRIPEGLEKALARLAKQTVQNGWDPGRVAMGLYRMLKAVEALSPEDRQRLREELARLRDARVEPQRKPRRFRRELP